VPPLVDFEVDLQWDRSVHFLRDDDLGAALGQIGDDPVRVERFVCFQPTELNTLDEVFHADGIVALAWQHVKPDQINKGVGEGQDLGRQRWPGKFGQPDR